MTSAGSIDLEKEIEELHASAVWEERGKSAKRLTSHDKFRINLIVLREGVSTGEHKNSGRVSIQTIQGHTRVRAGGETFDLPLRKLVVLEPSVPHDVEGVEDSAILVTIAFEV